jgi:hypothetical protein
MSTAPRDDSRLLAALEAISRSRPDRVLRLGGEVTGPDGRSEPLELLVFRGVTSSTSHPLDADPDTSALPQGAILRWAEILTAPLNPQAASVGGRLPPDRCLDPGLW